MKSTFSILWILGIAIILTCLTVLPTKDYNLMFKEIVSQFQRDQKLSFNQLSAFYPNPATALEEVSDGLHLIQEFFIFTSDDYRSRRLQGFPMAEIEDRQKELNSVLQRNLNNDLTTSLTILHNNDTSLRPFLKELNLNNSHKLMSSCLTKQCLYFTWTMYLAQV